MQERLWSLRLCYALLSSVLARKEETLFYLGKRSIHLSIGQSQRLSHIQACATGRFMLVQNQTTFSASHVQAYWAHLDHAVYKNEVS